MNTCSSPQKAESFLYIKPGDKNLSGLDFKLCLSEMHPKHSMHKQVHTFFLSITYFNSLFFFKNLIHLYPSHTYFRQMKGEDDEHRSIS